jgi:anti-anti-sigma factor
MLSRACCPALGLEWVGPTAVVRLPEGDLLDQKASSAVGDLLFGLVDRLMAGQTILLDFSNVVRVTSAFVAKLIGLHKRLQARGGRLAVCNANAIITGVFRLLALESLFGIYAKEQDALQSLQ